jgi:hypothetical protein
VNPPVSKARASAKPGAVAAPGAMRPIAERIGEIITHR